MEQLKFPIGRYIKTEVFTPELIASFVQTIETFPKRLQIEVGHLSDEQLNTPYRPEGWTIRQVVHHCADSHMNALIRFKLALTEDTPTVKPYLEDRWSELPDSKSTRIDSSIKILEGVHERLSLLLKSLTQSDLEREFIHPEHGRKILVKENIGLYAWHCDHHLAHITTLKKSKNWE